MPHFKCNACKVRLHRPGVPAEPAEDLCPDCGRLLEPVGELAEIVGFQSVTSVDSGGVSPEAVAEAMPVPTVTHPTGADL